MQALFNQARVLGIDIGGTNIRLALVDPNGHVEHSLALRVASLREADPLKHLVEVVQSYVAENTKPGELLAIGIGVPGIVNGAGRIISCPNITFLEDSQLQEILSETLEVPVFLEKDVNFILYGEYRSLGLQDIQNLIGFYVGTGFGCSLLIDGDIYRGARGFAGELGHVPLKNHRDLCNCGNEGCLELYAAGRSLVHRSAEQGIAVADFFSHDEVQIEDFIDYMGVGMLGAINVFDPEAIIVGGGVVQMADFPWEAFEARIRRGARSDSIRKELRIIPSQAATFGGCIGAAYYCYDQVKKTQDGVKQVDG